MDDKQISTKKVSMIKEIRTKYGFPLRYCSLILEKSNWSLENKEVFEEAMNEVIQLIANKKRDLEVKEGIIKTKHLSETKLRYMVIKSETDFNTGGEEFLELTEKVFELDPVADEKKINQLIDFRIAISSENIKLIHNGVFEGNYFQDNGKKKFIALKTNTDDNEINKKIARHVEAIGSDVLNTIYNSPWYLNQNITTKEFLMENNLVIEKALLLHI